MLDSFRSAFGSPVRIGNANAWLPDVRLNGGDDNGRLITVEITDNGVPVEPDGITAALLYNTSNDPADGASIPMNAVDGSGTATFAAALPGEALRGHARVTLAIEITADGSTTCTRPFHGIVEQAVCQRSDNKQNQDKEDQ